MNGLKGNIHMLRRNQTGENNSQYGTMWITNSIESKKIKKNEQIPNGWRKGRTLACLQKPKRKTKHQINHEKYEKKINQVYLDFKKSGLSLRKYCALYYDKSVPNLSRQFKKYVKL